ncbi:MAG: rhomboid family intramembrane serine protease [Paracoccaceae bacterium]
MRGSETVQAMRPILLLIAAIWIVEGVNQLLGHRLNQWFGLLPRSIPGLVGVPTMPLLHGGFGHAAANTLPLLILGSIGLAVAPKRFWGATALIILVSGLAVWVLARPAIVVGASGLIFGWFGFVLMLAITERSMRALAGAVVVIVIYGGMVWGVFPTQTGNISWEAHLFGALAGALVARMLRER